MSYPAPFSSTSGTNVWPYGLTEAQTFLIHRQLRQYASDVVVLVILIDTTSLVSLPNQLFKDSLTFCS